MTNLSATHDLRYKIDMARSQNELDDIERTLLAESYLHTRIKNARRLVRHIETTKALCETYLKN